MKRKKGRKIKKIINFRDVKENSEISEDSCNIVSEIDFNRSRIKN